MHPKVTATKPLGSLIGCLLLAVLAVPAHAQEEAVQSATLPLPASQRDAATIIARDGETWVVARDGEGDFICLADDPSDERFHVACYHHSLEPYMARGRELRAQGVKGRESISKRWEEIDAGQLTMPDHPAALYSLSGPASWGGDVDNLSPLSVLYVAYATSERLGVPAEPRPGRPWLMFPGKPSAHIMITP
jgi:hypothetical protein